MWGPRTSRGEGSDTEKQTWNLEGEEDRKTFRWGKERGQRGSWYLKRKMGIPELHFINTYIQDIVLLRLLSFFKQGSKLCQLEVIEIIFCAISISLKGVWQDNSGHWLEEKARGNEPMKGV